MNRMKQCLAIVLVNCVALVSTPDVFADRQSPAAVQPQEQTPQVAAQQTPAQCSGWSRQSRSTPMNW
jgi:hypothetical protein